MHAPTTHVVSDESPNKKLDEKNSTKWQANPSPLNLSKTPNDAIAHKNQPQKKRQSYCHTTMSLALKQKCIMSDANVDANHVNQSTSEYLQKEKKKASRDSGRMSFMSHCNLNNMTTAKQPIATKVPVTSGLLRNVLNGSPVLITCPITATFVSTRGSFRVGLDILGSG